MCEFYFANNLRRCLRFGQLVREFLKVRDKARKIGNLKLVGLDSLLGC